MAKDKPQWTAKQRCDLDCAKGDLKHILSELMEDAQITVLGMKSGRVHIEARWDEFDTHCLNISLDFPFWPGEAEV